MKESMSTSATILVIAILMQSCYSFTHVVGGGAQTGEVVKQKNHYLFYGLKKLKVSDSQKMVGNATDYEITVRHSVLDQLLNGFSLGIYTPTTTVVRK